MTRGWGVEANPRILFVLPSSQTDSPAEAAVVWRVDCSLLSGGESAKMTMPYPSSPNEPGQPTLPPVHAPGPQRIHEPIPVEPIHPELPETPTGPNEPGPEPPNLPPGGG